MREAQRAGSGGTVAIALLVLAVLGAGAWFGKSLFVGTPTSATTSPRPSATAEAPTVPGPTEPASTPQETTSDAPGYVAACRDAWTLQTNARNAAAVVLDQWDRHLDIMDDLQAGKIDLARAKELWPTTTKDAPAHIAAFHTADQAFTSSQDRCAAPEGSTSADSAAVQACAASLAVGDGVLAKARAAVEPFETHLKDQSHFKAGEMTAAKAEALWRSLWQKGLSRNPAYFAAATAGAKAGCTLPA